VGEQTSVERSCVAAARSSRTTKQVRTGVASARVRPTSVDENLSPHTAPRPAGCARRSRGRDAAGAPRRSAHPRQHGDAEDGAAEPLARGRSQYVVRSCMILSCSSSDGLGLHARARKSVDDDGLSDTPAPSSLRSSASITSRSPTNGRDPSAPRISGVSSRSRQRWRRRQAALAQDERRVGALPEPGAPPAT